MRCALVLEETDHDASVSERGHTSGQSTHACYNHIPALVYFLMKNWTFMVRFMSCSTPRMTSAPCGDNSTGDTSCKYTDMAAMLVAVSDPPGSAFALSTAAGASIWAWTAPSTLSGAFVHA